MFGRGNTTSEPEETSPEAERLKDIREWSDNGNIQYAGDKELEFDASTMNAIETLTTDIDSTLDDEERAILEEKKNLYHLQYDLNAIYKNYEEHKKAYEDYQIKYSELVAASQAVTSASDENGVSHDQLKTAAEAGAQAAKLRENVDAIRSAMSEDREKINKVIDILIKKVTKLIETHEKFGTKLGDYKDWLENEAKQHFQDVHDTFHPTPPATP